MKLTYFSDMLCTHIILGVQVFEFFNNFTKKFNEKKVCNFRNDKLLKMNNNWFLIVLQRKKKRNIEFE